MMYDPEAIYQDADIEMMELAAAADEGFIECECPDLRHGQTTSCGVEIPAAGRVHRDLEDRPICPFCAGFIRDHGQCAVTIR